MTFAETDRVLRATGWFPGRAVPTGEWETALRSCPVSEAARAFLAEFGGLAVTEHGPGRTMARVPFRLDPLVAVGDEEVFGALSEMAAVPLFPIGEADRRNLYLGIAPDGAVYAGMDSVALLGATPRRALRNLVEGIREELR